MKNKLTEEQEKRLLKSVDDLIPVMGSAYNDLSVRVAYKEGYNKAIRSVLAEEIARAREGNNETMTDREEILLLRIDSKLSHLLRLQRLAFDPVNNDLFRLKKGEEKRYIRE